MIFPILILSLFHKSYFNNLSDNNWMADLDIVWDTMYEVDCLILRSYYDHYW